MTGITKLQARNRTRLGRVGVRAATHIGTGGRRRDLDSGGRCGAVAWVLVVLMAAGFAACAKKSASVERDAAVYAAVVRWFAAGLDPATSIFLDGPDGVEVDLAVQAEVLGLLKDFDVVRFIDTVSEAVDETVPGAPVRAEGIFVRLGSVTGDRRVSVTADRYVSENETKTYVFTLERRQGEWEIQGSPDLTGVGG